MKPTTDQKLLLMYFITKLKEVYDLDVSEYNEEVEKFGDKIDKELREWGKENQHYAGLCIRDIVTTIIDNP